MEVKLKKHLPDIKMKKETDITPEFRSWLLSNRNRFIVTGSQLISGAKPNDYDFIVPDHLILNHYQDECAYLLEIQQAQHKADDGYIENLNIIIIDKDKTYNFIVCLDPEVTEGWQLANNAFIWAIESKTLAPHLKSSREFRIEFFRSIRLTHKES